MKITDKQRSIYALVIALIMIGMGAIQGLFKLDLNKGLSQFIQSILFISAAVILLGGKKQKNSNGSKPEEEKVPEDCSKNSDN